MVFRPSRFVRTGVDDEPTNSVDVVTSAVGITAFYFLNLLLYALPLTLAGFGVQGERTAPAAVATLLNPVVDNPDTAWQFASALVQNSTYLLLATILTFVTFHVGITLAGSADSVLHSLRAVGYSTGIYLAVMFSAVWYVSTASGLEVAEQLLLWIQAEFIQLFIDLVGADLAVPVEASRPELAAMTTLEQAVLTVLLLSTVYFLYVLYAAARVSHRATRSEALLATTFVLASPALYVLSVIFLTTGL